MTTEPIDLRNALDKHLTARSLSKSIGTLLKSKRKTIDFDPYYQRNYVWDPHKATFFIESILLGIEIPPLIMFIPANDKRKYEVIDGRQRFETLKRFFKDDLKLTKRGLRKLSGIKGQKFQKLDSEIQRTFLNTTIRIIEFSIIGEHPNPDELEDRIKKEIFWRYNSGITPLKTLEVQRAQHLNDSFTEIMEEEFENYPVWLDQFKEVFFAKKDPKKRTDAECQAKIRELLVLEHFPINIYSSTSGRKETIEWLYELYIEGATEHGQILKAFKGKVDLLHQFFIILNEKEWMIYQAVYWALIILEQNSIDTEKLFTSSTLENLKSLVQKNIEIFTGSDRGFSKVTIRRFKCLGDFFEDELKNIGFQKVDFSIYLKNSLKDKKIDQKTSEVTDTIKQLDTMRLNRPDAVTKTIEDLIGDNSFLIRPSYQRQEVINIKKASGIIESMLLGIPLPTIFIYRRADAIDEVVDGQQRLLSILGFLGEPYKDDKHQDVKSEKNEFKLFKKMTILKEIEGKKYGDLGEDYQERIWDFELSVVYIDQKLNKNFDPIDLFIRLNNKPYPVKDHTFEMWNSYSERSIIEKIKNINKKYKLWFYYRQDNRRMNNEELLAVFAYLNFRSHENIDAVFENIDIYNWEPNALIFRSPKYKITEWLRTAEGQRNITQREEILSSINEVEDFIIKVEVLIRSPQQSEDDQLAQLFNNLLGIKGTVRQQKPFYVLWFLLLRIDKQIIEKQSTSVIQEISEFFSQHQVIPQADTLTVKDIFRKNVEAFWAKFNS